MWRRRALPSRASWNRCTTRSCTRPWAIFRRRNSRKRSRRSAAQPRGCRPTLRQFWRGNMSFLRHGEIYRPISSCGSKPEQPGLDCPGAHRTDEFPAGYSLAGCAPAEPASASPAGVHRAAGRSGSTIEKQPTANSGLNCLSHSRGQPQPLLVSIRYNFRPQLPFFCCLVSRTIKTT